MESTEQELTETGAALQNRTGAMTAPELTADLVEGTAATQPSMEGGEREIALYRAEFIKEADPIGSLPALDSETTGEVVFLDKLGERLAFERQGTRLYEALIHKCEALDVQSEIGPSLDDLRHICHEEKEHFRLIQRVIMESGGDPTVETPSADIVSVTSIGPLQVVTDPRTTLTQCLQAMLTAELVDNDGWDLLKNLATALGRDDLASQFDEALAHEDEHLEKVRLWLSAMVLEEADVEFEIDEMEVDVETLSEERPKKSAGTASKKARKKKK